MTNLFVDWSSILIFRRRQQKTFWLEKRKKSLTKNLKILTVL